MTTPAPEVDTPEAFRRAPILPLLLFGFGAYLLWFGVKYWKGAGAAVWPSYPLRSVLQGQGVPSNVPATATADTLTAYEMQAVSAIAASSAGSVAAAAGTATTTTGTGQKKGTTTAAGRGSGSGGTGAAPVGSNANRGRLLAAKRGWTGQQWDCLNNIVMAESSWDNRVWNGGGTGPTRPANSDGGYGIPQATPFTKMPHAAWPPGYGGTADPNTQIEWMLGYIATRYGTPCAAWAYHQAHGIY